MEGKKSSRFCQETSRQRNRCCSLNSRDTNEPVRLRQLDEDLATPMRIFTQESLSNLQRQNDDAVTRMTKDLDKEAHFLPYAPPSFIGFRQGAYLQLSISTRLDAAAATSRYKLAALAFDEHVSHLVRPLLAYFPQDPDFDGVDFSSMIHVADGSSPLAVEFFFPSG